MKLKCIFKASTGPPMALSKGTVTPQEETIYQGKCYSELERNAIDTIDFKENPKCQEFLVAQFCLVSRSYDWPEKTAHIWRRHHWFPRQI